MIVGGYDLIRKSFSSIILLLVTSVAFGQEVKIEVKAPESVLVGEQFRVDYVIQSDSEVDEVVMVRNMEGFTILYGPSVSNSSSIQFKKGKRVVTYTSTSTYYLEAASKEGKYTIPKAEITFKGKKYKSNTFSIEIKSVKDAVGEIDAFVRTVISKPSVNLSDTVMLTYRLYTTKEINRIISTDFPTIDGFYSSNVTRSRQTFTEETIDGKVYKVADLRRLILQPQKIGQVTIPEGQIMVEYATPTGKKVRDMWGDVYNETLRSEKTLTIDSVIIRITDLKAI